LGENGYFSDFSSAGWLEGGHEAEGEGVGVAATARTTTMRTKILTLSFTPSLGGFDDLPLTDFVRDKEVLSLREYFFEVLGFPHLLCVVDYADAARLPSSSRPVRASADAEQASSGRDDAVARMSAPDRALFLTLRAWRNEQARNDGVPPYVLFTNAELVRVVLARPASTSALGAVEGIGPGKVRRYGEAILRALNGVAQQTPSAAESAPNAATPTEAAP